jgi:hypothetical protein
MSAPSRPSSSIVQEAVEKIHERVDKSVHNTKRDHHLSTIFATVSLFA